MLTPADASAHRPRTHLQVCALFIRVRGSLCWSGQAGQLQKSLACQICPVCAGEAPDALPGRIAMAAEAPSTVAPLAIAAAELLEWLTGAMATNAAHWITNWEAAIAYFRERP